MRSRDPHGVRFDDYPLAVAYYWRCAALSCPVVLADIDSDAGDESGLSGRPVRSGTLDHDRLDSRGSDAGQPG